MTENPQTALVYLDSNILAFWFTAFANPERKFSRRVEAAKSLLNSFREGRLNITFVTSEWSLEELIQSFVDRALWAKFPYEAPEFRELRSMREAGLTEKEIQTILDAISRFERLLEELKVQYVPNIHDHKELHRLVLKYMLETP